jgi:hypothetical protein
MAVSTGPGGYLVGQSEAGSTDMIGWEHIQHLGKHLVSSYTYSEVVSL